MEDLYSWGIKLTTARCEPNAMTGYQQQTGNDLMFLTAAEIEPEEYQDKIINVRYNLIWIKNIFV